MPEQVAHQSGSCTVKAPACEVRLAGDEDEAQPATAPRRAMRVVIALCAPIVAYAAGQVAAAVPSELRQPLPRTQPQHSRSHKSASPDCSGARAAADHRCLRWPCRTLPPAGALRAVGSRGTNTATCTSALRTAPPQAGTGKGGSHTKQPSYTHGHACVIIVGGCAEQACLRAAKATQRRRGERGLCQTRRCRFQQAAMFKSCCAIFMHETVVQFHVSGLNLAP